MMNMPRVNFITAGQTPRVGMLREVFSSLDSSFEVFEYGALDGLDDRAIAELSPMSGERSIRTKLRDGRFAIISEAWLRDRISQICNSLNRSSEDITVIGSTSSYGTVSLGHHVLHAESALQNTIETLVVADQKIGRIVSLKSQIIDPTLARLPCVTSVHARPEDDTSIVAAARRIAHCDFIVLCSMAHSERHREMVMEITGKPVILMRRVVARIVARSMDSRAQNGAIVSQEMSSDFTAKYAKLSKREREVFQMVINGMANKSIATTLSISTRTVEIHRSRIMKKFGVKHAVALLACVKVRVGQATLAGLD